MTKQPTAQEFISAIHQTWDHSECWLATAAARTLSEEDERRIREMMDENEVYGDIHDEVMAHIRMRVASMVGTRIGKAIARDVLADDLPREWTGLDPQDGDQLTSAGIDCPSPEWDAAEQAAQAEYERIVGA